MLYNSYKSQEKTEQDQHQWTQEQATETYESMPICLTWTANSRY